MPLQIVRENLINIECGAIVNSTNAGLICAGNGVDKAVHAAAGPGLAGKLDEIGYCPVGSSVVTDSFEIKNCAYIIHAVPPVFSGDTAEGVEQLKSCYRSIFENAGKLGVSSIAMPVLSAGANGFPKAEAYRTATECTREYLDGTDGEFTVYLAVYNDEIAEICSSFSDRVERYIRKGYIEPDALEPGEDACAAEYTGEGNIYGGISVDEVSEYAVPCQAPQAPAPCASVKPSAKPGLIRPKAKKRKEKEKTQAAKPAYDSVCTAQALPQMQSAAEDYRSQDRSFGEMCDWWMDRKGIKISEFYSRANITKAAFYNIRSNPGRAPKKTTVFACAVGLGLDYDETCDLILRAGYTFSPYMVTDVIVRGYIEDRNYDIDEINAVLYDRDLALLGSNAM